jgi:hypothetical protein
VVDDVTLAVYEALANAVEHAYHPHHPNPVMHLQARIDHTQLLITVTDHGCWAPSRRTRLPRPGVGDDAVFDHRASIVSQPARHHRGPARRPAAWVMTMTDVDRGFDPIHPPVVW